jgi:hypothetical protein
MGADPRFVIRLPGGWAADLLYSSASRSRNIRPFPLDRGAQAPAANEHDDDSRYQDGREEGDCHGPQ